MMSKQKTQYIAWNLGLQIIQFMYSEDVSKNINIVLFSEQEYLKLEKNSMYY